MGTKLPDNLNHDTTTGLTLSAQRLLFTILHTQSIYRALQSARHFHNGGERNAFRHVLDLGYAEMHKLVPGRRRKCDTQDVKDYLAWQCDHDRYGEYTGASDRELKDIRGL